MDFQLHGVDVDVFIATYLNQGVTMTFDLLPPKYNQDTSRGQWLFPASFIEIAQVVNEIWCSEDLTSTAC